MTCTCCGKERHEVHAGKSRLMPDVKVLRCNECQANKREPRYIIIIHGRRHGIESVIKVIKERRYCGNEIAVSELVK